MAAAALAAETYADAELLAFRWRDRDHRCYTRGLWALCRHPNFAAELVFQVSVATLLIWHSPEKAHAVLGLAVTATAILLLPGGVRTLEERAMNAWDHAPENVAYRERTFVLVPAFTCTWSADRACHFPGPGWAWRLWPLGRGSRPVLTPALSA